MKKRFLLKTMFLLCALIAGSGTMWGETVTYTFTAKEWTSASGNWSGDAGNALDTKGVQCLKDNTYTVSSPSSLSNISSIVVTYGTAKSTTTSSTISIKVGSGEAVSKNVAGGSKTDAELTWSYNPTVTGSISMSVGAKGASVYVKSVSVTYSATPSHTISTAVNNSSYGSVSLSGTTITADPEDGYRVMNGSDGYTVTSGTATVAHEGYSNTLTVTPSTDCTVQVNFEEIPKYKVTFNAEGGSCATSSLTESIGEGGVTLPTATTSVAGWEFIGWAESTIANTTTMPSLYKAGSIYHPTSDITLHAVYTLSETSSTFVRVTSLNQVDFAKSIVVVKNSDNYVLNHTKGTGVTAPTESNSEITAPDNTIFTLSGNNTDGFVLTGANGTLSQSNLSTSSANDHVVDWSGENNQWKIEENAYASNTFALSNSTNVALEYYSGWKTEYNTSYNNRQYTAMKLYVPKSAYDSNPSALITPTVAFGSTDPVTLYLDGTTTNTNTATVTGVSKTINYTSSNTSVATVTSEGVVTAVGIGTATITASVDAELGVSSAASASYDITVKSATTLAGIKAVATSSEKDFTADLASDLVITYVNGSHAYLQNGDVAIYASCGDTEGWAAGKKFTGPISGKVKLNASEYQITAIDQTPVTGGVVPDAVEVNISDLTIDSYATYEGRKLAINGATISAALSSSSSTGGKISDGENTLNIYAPLTGITLTKDEKGNFIGFFGRNGNNLRYYMYEQSQFTKTHNVPVDQEISFTNSSYNLDEETAAVTSFTGQEVTKTTVKGTVTYSIKDGSNNIITSLDSSTGAVVLNGARGTATIVATAAAAEVTEGGYITPYNELSKEYTITVRPRYTVTFSVNGVETSLREESYNAGITVPANPSAVGSFVFQGWSSTTIATTTDTKPSLASFTAGNNYKPSDEETYYAVFAVQTQTGTTDVLDQSYSYGKNLTPGGSEGTYEDKNKYYLLHENGYVESEVFDLSIISKVVVYGGTYGGSQYNSLTIGDGTNTWKNVTVSGSNNDGTNSYTDGNALSGNGKLRITSTCGGTTNGVRVSGFEIYKLGPVYGYSNYCTTIPPEAVTITPAYAKITYVTPYKMDFTEVSGLKAYVATAAGAGSVTMTRVEAAVPENTPLLLMGTANTEYSVPVATTATAPETNKLVAGDGTTVFDGTTYDYILYSDGKFYQIGSGTVAVGKAYLHLDSDPAGARSLNITFDDSETTSVDGRWKMEEGRGDVYNLNGQKVAQPAKGLYIVNGKKVVIK